MLLPYHTVNRIEAGCDEAGRGCIAGPVFAAAVILPNEFNLPHLNDSKKLNRAQRDKLRNEIELQAIDFAVAKVNPHEIDQINILNASIKSMHLALSKMKKDPAFILVDGNKFKPYGSIPYECIIKGDGKYASIAAASILAKTYRDEYMEVFALRYPVYNWQSNKGYPTVEHKQAVFKHGPCIHHRISFRLNPIAQQGKLF